MHLKAEADLFFSLKDAVQMKVTFLCFKKIQM